MSASTPPSVLRRLLLLGSVGLCAGCASISGTAPSSFHGAPGWAERTQAGTDRNRNVITAEEVAECEGEARNALELVVHLRPTWLRAGMRSSAPDAPIIYLDGVRSNDPSALEFLSTLAVQEIRFLSRRDATTRYGPNHGGGAILVTTRIGG